MGYKITLQKRAKVEEQITTEHSFGFLSSAFSLVLLVFHFLARDSNVYQHHLIS